MAGPSARGGGGRGGRGGRKERIPLVSQDEGVDVSSEVDEDYPDQRRVVVVTMAADPLLKTGVRLAMQHRLTGDRVTANALRAET